VIAKKPHKDLTWVEVDEAAPRLLQAMRENGWDGERIQSHLQFWMALGSHEYRHDSDEFGKRALIVYQDTARRRWHNLLGTPQSFDLVPIDKGMIKEIRDKLLHKEVSSVLLSPLFEHTGSHPGLLSAIESAIRARRVTQVWSSVHKVPAGIESRSSAKARFWGGILVDVGRGSW
jgi:hypothetical protein